MTLVKNNTPNVVALGGGHGLGAVLKALRTYTNSITGIVSVADDGGSSGILRNDYGIPAPGDIRRCITALSDDSLLAKHIEDRFDNGDLVGHPIGNVLLAGLTLATNDFQAAIDELCRLVKAEGELYPATIEPVTLIADVEGVKIHGQVAIEDCIQNSNRITNLRFDTKNPTVPEKALARINSADQIIIGPGSLLTSVIAAVIIPEITEAINASSGKKIFIANINNESPAVDVNDVNYQVDLLSEYGIEPEVVVYPNISARSYKNSDWISSDILADNNLRHDSNKLGSVLQGFV